MPRATANVTPMIDLATAGVCDAVRQRPDYAACLVTARGVHGGPSDEASDAALTRAERYAAQLLDAQDLAAIPQVAQWREAFRAFGVRPRSATSSLESLLRRAAAGLPRVDRLTDHYNAISIAHLVPSGYAVWHRIRPPWDDEVSRDQSWPGRPRRHSPRMTQDDPVLARARPPQLAGGSPRARSRVDPGRSPSCSLPSGTGSPPIHVGLGRAQLARRERVPAAGCHLLVPALGPLPHLHPVRPRGLAHRCRRPSAP